MNYDDIHLESVICITIQLCKHKTVFIYIYICMYVCMYVYVDGLHYTQHAHGSVFRVSTSPGYPNLRKMIGKFQP